MAAVPSGWAPAGAGETCACIVAVFVLGTGCGSAQNAGLAREDRRLGPARDTELVEDMRHVDGRRLCRDEQARADLAIRAAVRQQRQDLTLAGRQAPRIGRKAGVQLGALFRTRR